MAVGVQTPDPDGQSERYEQGKITLSRDIKGKPWWRITVYVGDQAPELDAAVDEALRLDARMRAEA